MTAVNITLTPAAKQHITKCLIKHSGSIGIKIGVKNSGCNGHSYTIDYLDAKPANHHELTLSECGSVFVSPDDLTNYLDGLTLDYEQQGLNGVIRFINPNAKNSCGCGESFSIKDREDS